MLKNTQDKSTALTFSRRQIFSGQFGSLHDQNAVSNLYNENETSYIDPKRIITKSGAFIPLYETHSVGIRLDEIPENSDYCFLETIIPADGAEPFFGNEIPVMTTMEIVERLDKQRNKLFKYLSKNNIKLILADVAIPNLSLESRNKFIKTENDIGTLLLGIAGGIALTNKINRIKSRKNEGPTERTLDKNSKISRRQFITYAGIIASFVGLWAKTPSLARNRVVRDNVEVKLTSEERLIIRAKAIQSLLHPEYPTIFFRNLIWVIKMLDLAEHHKEINKQFGIEPKNDPPIIPMKVGSSHGGIEDMFKAGKRFCLKLLSALYTKEYFVEVAKLNNGSTLSAQSVIIQFPENYQGLADLEQNQPMREWHTSTDLQEIFRESHSPLIIPLDFLT